MTDPKTIKIAHMAYFVARTYGLGYPNHPQTWAEWKKLSPNACNDFWDIAQSELDIPAAERVEWPEGLDLDNLPPQN